MPSRYIPVQPKPPKWLPEVAPTREDWIRLAAFIDGEGHIGIARSAQGKGYCTYQVNLSIVNTNTRLIEWIMAVFGGGSSWVKRARGYEDRPWRPALQWRASCKHALWIIEGCQPHLLLKNEQASVARAFADTLGKPGLRVDDSVMAIREQLRLRMHELNGKYVKRFISEPLARRADARITRHQTPERNESVQDSLVN